MPSVVFGSVFFLALVGVCLLIAILWILMPFAIFGTKDLLRQLIREQRKTNELLQAQASRTPAVVTRPAPVAPSERVDPPLSRIHAD